MNTRYSSAFEDQLISTSKRALIELIRTLRPYKEAIVLVGGWVPYLLLEAHKSLTDNFRHVGSIDIDLVLDPKFVGEHQYQTIVELIVESGWNQVSNKKFTFEKSIKGEDNVFREITVDFLTLQENSQGKKHRHREIQPDLMARTMVGAEISLEHNFWHSIKGEMPNGAVTEINFKMLDVVGCIGSKGMALGDRYKHKDAYDIVSVLDHYGEGVNEVARKFSPFLKELNIEESLKKISEKFSNERSEGPVLYADFLEPLNKEERELYIRRGYMIVSEFLLKSGFQRKL